MPLEKKENLADIEKHILSALATADAISAVLLGAKLDDALVCVREMSARDGEE